MLRNTGVERVGGQSIFATQQAKSTGRDDDVRILRLETDRAITVFDFNAVRLVRTLSISFSANGSGC